LSDYRGTRLEWCAVADVSHYALMALSILTETIDGLTVNVQKMEGTAQAYGDAICTEAVVFERARTLGKSSAYQIIFEVSQASQRNHVSIREAIEADARVLAVMNDGALARLFEPRTHLGMSERIVDNVLARLAGH